jgi:RNA polymerase sigma factor (sigma-70 family)
VSGKEPGRWSVGKGGALLSPLLLSLRCLQAQPDSRLVALTRQGHEAAFEVLVRRYRGELLAYCRRLQPRSGLAEDALQQTLLQAWKALNDGAEVREVRAWLYRIAHNVSLNHLRAAAAAPQEVAKVPEQPTLDQLVEQRRRARAALAGLASLPTLQREALLSTTFEGASHTDVANALGLSSGAVRGLVYRARATLRAAAAAVTPGPLLQWAIRRTDVGSGGFPSVAGTFAAGSGAGAAGMLAKTGSVLVLAVAGASGVVLTHHARPQQKAKVQLMRPHDGSRSVTLAAGSGVVAAAPAALVTSGSRDQPRPGQSGTTARGPGAGGRAERGRGRGSSGGDRRGSRGGGSDSRAGRGGSDRGSTSGSSEGDSSHSTGPAAVIGSGSSEGGSSSGSDGGSGSSGNATSPVSGSDGDMTTPSATTAAVTSSASGGGQDSGSSGGSDGSSGGSDGSSGSIDGSSPDGG